MAPDSERTGPATCPSDRPERPARLLAELREWRRRPRPQPTPAHPSAASTVSSGAAVEAVGTRGYITTMRPPRPELSNAVPPPIATVPSAPPSVRSVGALWLLGTVIGVAALIAAFLDRGTHLDVLRETARNVEGAGDTTVVDQVTLIALWGTLAVYALVLLVEALLVRPLLRGRGRTRWALLVMIVLNAGAVLLVLAFLRDGSGGFQPAPHLATVQLVLAALAFVLGLVPPASHWFREGRSRR